MKEYSVLKIELSSGKKLKFRTKKGFRFFVRNEEDWFKISIGANDTDYNPTFSYFIRCGEVETIEQECK